MLTIDANVWIAAADTTDVFCPPSRTFLARTAHQQATIYLPAFAWVELACALARRRQDARAGRQLTAALLSSPQIVRIDQDASFLAQALLAGTQAFLRGADSLYAATAQLTGAQLVSWDIELVRRAGAITPTDWLVANP